MYEKMYRNIISQLKYAVFYFYKPRSTSMCMNAVVRFLEILKQYDQLIYVFFRMTLILVWTDYSKEIMSVEWKKRSSRVGLNKVEVKTSHWWVYCMQIIIDHHQFWV
jgi:hypothetical protein